MNVPKVFISYSWTTPTHEKWVLDLANRLIADGVDVKFDKWDLKEGHDKFHYMEQMVLDPTLNKVLIICDNGYKAKADAKKGGVGTESLIISKEIYDSVIQEKFIPIISEKDASGNGFLPVFIHSRIYVDLSEPEKFESEYEKLLRNIFDKPALLKPPIGRPPIYIITEPTVVIKTAHMIQQIKTAIENNKSYQYDLARQYLEIFSEAIEDFRLDFSKPDFEPCAAFDGAIASYNYYLLDYYAFLKESVKFDDQYKFAEILHGFLEENLKYNERPATLNSWSEHWFDNFKYINYELFIITLTFFLENKNYNLLSFLFSEPFLAKDAATNDFRPIPFQVFNPYNQTLETTCKQQRGTNWISETGNYFIQRALQNKIGNISLAIEVDFLLFLRSYLHCKNHFEIWYPRLFIYSSQYNEYKLIPRAVRRKYFAILASLLNVHTKDELVQLYARKQNEMPADKIFRGYSYNETRYNKFTNFEGMDVMN